MIYGILLITFSVALLWFNERRAVITRYRLYEANGLCRVTNSSEVNTSLEGNLICTSGKAETYEKVSDE